MSRLSREVIKEQLVQAIFDVLDELETKMDDVTVDEEANLIADAVFQVITETDDEDLSATEFFETGTDDVPDTTDEEN